MAKAYIISTLICWSLATPLSTFVPRDTEYLESTIKIQRDIQCPHDPCPMSHPYCGKRRYILFTIHISVYIKYWYVMLCLIQTLNLFNTYLHLILDVQLYTRVATTVYPVWMGLAREQTGGQSDSWDTGHFLTLLHSASCLKTQCHTMKLYFFFLQIYHCTDFGLHSCSKR